MKVLIALILAGTFVPVYALAGPCDPSTRTIIGNNAQALITALDIAGASKTPKAVNSSTNTFTYSSTELSCAVTDAGVEADGVSEFFCDSGDPEISETAIAKVTIDALSQAGVFADSGMSKSYFSASNIQCVTTVADQITYSCTLTAIWADTCQP